MAHRTYPGLGTPDMAMREFDALAPHVAQMLSMQAECAPFGPDWAAMGIALDGLDSAAYHFTRRSYFYHALSEAQGGHVKGNGRLNDRQEAVAAFKALTPYADRLRALQFKCRPFGRDYLAIDLAKQSLESAAFHFTRYGAFYGAKADTSGPIGPQF